MVSLSVLCSSLCVNHQLYVITIIGGDTAAPVSQPHHLSTITPFLW